MASRTGLFFSSLWSFQTIGGIWSEDQSLLVLREPLEDIHLLGTFQEIPSTY